MDPNQPPLQTNSPVPNPPVDPLAGYGAVPQASGSGSYSPPPPSSPKKNKLPFIIAGVVVALLLIITVLVVITSGKKSPSKPQPQANTSDNGSSFLKAADPIGVQQTSDSISQDLGGLNDDIDFPPNKIDDKSLSL